MLSFSQEMDQHLLTVWLRNPLRVSVAGIFRLRRGAGTHQASVVIKQVEMPADHINP